METNLIKYYDGNKLLSYGNNINFCLGQRSVGKSFYFKKYVLHHYFKTKKKFIIVYRYDSDIELKGDNYLNNVIDAKYNNYSIKLQNLYEYILINKKTKKKKIIGYAISISKMARLNSADFSDVDIILFDEFITIDDKLIGGKTNPLKEANILINFYQTVARGYNKAIRDVKLIFISNTVTISNPYFVFFELDKKIRIGQSYINFKNKNITVEFTKNESITTEIKKSQFYKNIENTKYADFAIANDFYLDNNNFIIKKLKNKKPLFNFICDNKTYTLYESKKWYLFSDDASNDKNIIDTITITDQDFKPQYKKILAFKKSKIYSEIIKMYENNYLYFNSQTAFRTFLFIFNIT